MKRPFDVIQRDYGKGMEWFVSAEECEHLGGEGSVCCIGPLTDGALARRTADMLNAVSGYAYVESWPVYHKEGNTPEQAHRND